MANQVDPAVFRQLLSEYNEQFMMEGTRGWKPDKGQYMCVLREVRRAVFADKATNQRVMAITPIVEIVDGPLAGKAFEINMFTPKNFSFFGPFVKVVGGRDFTSLMDACDMLDAAVADKRLLLVEVTETASKKNPGQLYKNADVLQVLNVAPAK